jgi:enoyl-CoA hydratase/carnithine racemase
MTEPVLLYRDGALLTLTLNRPERRNPISDADMIDAMCSALEAADRDMGVRCVVLTGAGSGFSSGGDLGKMKAGSGLRAHLPAETRRNYKAGIQRLPLLFESLEVPVVAAINGAAIGAGLDLACMCDVRIASDTARFAESFVKIGIVPGDGGAWLLPRIIGFSKACELALTGDTIDAHEARAIGLVSQVVAPDRLLDEARAIAARIASNPPHAVRMTKRLLREAQGMTLKAVLEMSAAYQALAHETEDHDEAVAAFMDKRAPLFGGR